MMRQRFAIFPVLLMMMLMVSSTSVSAFDDDKTISDVRLKNESFLDINSHSFRKSLDLEWFNTFNGWRMGGGSVSTNRTFIQSDLRLMHQLSRKFNFGLEIQYEHFYAPKSQPLPLVMADVYPSSDYDIGVSFLGTPAYDKRESDLGFAVTVGRRPGNYVRFSSLTNDIYYDEKNEYDQSFYEEHGRFLMLEGSYRFNNGWEVHFDLDRDTPLEFVFDNQTSRFEHESYYYKTSIVYRRSIHQAIGANIRSMFVDKRLMETANDQNQQIDYQSLDVYWINSKFRRDRELTIGIRYDNFEEQLRDTMDVNEDYDFKLSTWQAYSTLFHDYAPHMAWDVGLYLGWSERSKDYVVSNPDSSDYSGIQGKLRLSWQYHALDKSSVFLISMTLNLDDLANDPGDGGGLSFQTRF